MAIKAIKARLKLSLKRGIKGRSDGAGRNGSTASRGTERAARGTVARPGSAGTVGKTDPTGGVHTSARGEREGADDGRRESKEKAYFCNYANGVHGPSGLGQPVGFGLREKRGQRGPAGPKAEWAARSAGPKARKRISELKLDF